MSAEPASAPGFVPLDVRFPGSRDEQFEAFVADVGPYLLRVALLLSGDRNHAEDLVGALPLAQRRVVVLRHLLDLTESETAIELAVSVGTVKSHNARALARLRTLLMEGRQ